MKKTIITTLTSVMLLITGCKIIPSTDSMYTTSKSIGVSVGLVMNNTKIDDYTRNVIIEISNKIAVSVPTCGQTFTDSWLPKAIRYCDELAGEGRIDGIQHDLIISLFTAGVRTLDKFVYEKHPEIGTDVELVEAASNGFFDGFLTVFKPANTLSAPVYEYNEDAYKFMEKAIYL